MAVGAAASGDELLAPGGVGRDVVGVGQVGEGHVAQLAHRTEHEGAQGRVDLLEAAVEVRQGHGDRRVVEQLLDEGAVAVLTQALTGGRPLLGPRTRALVAHTQTLGPRLLT